MINMEQRRLLLLLAQLVALDQGAVALLPSLPATTPPRTTTLAFTTRPPDTVRGAFINTFSKLSLPVRRKSILYASISSSLSASSAPSDNSLENAVDATTTTVVTTTTIKTIISTHLEEATLASNNNDTPTQANELDLAEQLLMQWVEDYRSSQVATAAATSGGESDGAFDADDGAHGEGGELQQDTLEIPGADVFNNVIMGLLSLPSSFPIISSESNADDSIPSANAGGVNEEALTNEIRSLLGKGKSSSSNKNNNNRILNDGNSKSERATHILDLMEEFHEPQGSIYDAIIASHGSDALDRLAHHSTTQQRSNENSNVGNEQEGEGGAKDKSNDVVERKSTPSPYYQQAWKSAKAAYELLNRSEELYRETGQLSSRLPSISSYVTMMDVWKALAVSSEELDHGEKSTSNKKRDEALEIVRNLRQRRLEVYSLNHGNDENSDELEESGRKYNIIPLWVTDSVEDVLEFASDFLREKVPSYTPNWDASNESNGDTEASRVGTWHFNQLIFDLAEHPTSFSGPLAQDLLEFMVSTVKTTSPVIAPQKKLNSKKKGVPVDENILNPNVPKPTVDTINGVLKAWMVTPGTPDSARRAEAVLAQLAIWQSEGTIWGVNPDIVSYNTCINCWKESGIVGAAERATDILTLLEDDSIEVSPDVITYASCMAAWAALGAGRRAEEILLRMYNRSREEDASSSLPKPTTRCFNAVLLAYANGKVEGGGKRALELLQFMERLHSEGYDDVQPDAYTLNIVMKALTNCGESGAARKANQLLRRMEESFSSGNSRLKPDLLSYNTVLDAFAKKGDAESAEKLLNQMYARAERESSSGGIAKPNAYSYTAVINAWARSEDKALAVQRAEDLINELDRKYAAGETDLRADTSVYNALINCWAKSGERKALYRVTQILDLMEELGLQGGDSDVQPNSRTYCSVLDALAKSKNWKATNESLDILTRMEEFYAEGHESVRPCARAYSIVISTIGRSKRKGKAEMAQDILHRMESEYRKGNVAARPNVYSYNAVLNAAAFTNGDEREQEEAFKVACLTFDELRMSNYLQPSHVSYGTFLKAIKKLMPESDVRNDLVKGLFRRCCRDGQVGDLVLLNMKALTSPDFYQTLLEGVADYGLPKSWSANVKERDAAMRT